MKIGIDARHLGEKYTGIGIYTERLIENLLQIDTENEYVIFLGKENFSSLEFQRPAKKVLADIPWYSVKEQIRFVKILEKEKTDIMHFTNFNVPVFYTRNFIATVHDTTPWQFPGEKSRRNFFRRLCFIAVFDTMMKRSDAVLAVSNHTKSGLIKRYAKFSSKIITITLGVGSEFKIPKDYGKIEELKRRFSIQKPFIFYVGVHRKHKNIPGLILAFEKLRNVHHKDIQLVIGGRDEKPDPEIFTAIESHRLKDHIVFPGFLSKQDLALMYSAAEVTVIPSFQEGFGLVGVESLASGTPVAASKTTSLPEVLGDSALYFNPNDEKEMSLVILRILSNRDLSRKLVRRGLETIKAYSWETCARKTLDIYRSIYDKKKKTKN